MKINKIIIMVLLIIAVMASIVILSNRMIYDISPKIYDITVILRSENSDNLMILKQGVDQAAIDLNANVRFLTLANNNDYNEQKDILIRELENGVEGVIIAPADCYELSGIINELSKEVEIVLIDTNIVGNEIIPFISCNNYELGKSLAEEVIKEGNINEKILIVDTEAQISSIDSRIDGFTTILDNTKNSYEVLEVSNDLEIVEIELIKKIDEDDIDVVIAFEAKILEVLGSIKKDLINNKEVNDVNLYGIGNTSEIITLLEEGIINSVGVQNEFNIGYLAVKNIINLINEKDINDSMVDYSVINRRDMYSDENQRLLFPFIR